MPGEISTPPQEEFKTREPIIEEGWKVPLADQIKKSREERVSGIIEKDAAKAEARRVAKEQKIEAKKAEREQRKAARLEARAARKEKFDSAKDNTKDKVKRFRAWDRKMTLTLGGEIASIPKIMELTAKRGFEISRDFVIARKNEVVETVKRVDTWLEKTDEDLEDFYETTISNTEEWVDGKVQDAHDKANDAKDYLSETYLNAKTYAGLEAKRHKDKVVKSVNKVRASRLETRAMAYNRTAERVRRKFERQQRRVDKSVEIYEGYLKASAEYRIKAESLKDFRATFVEETS
jgi:hypothetical protein